MRIPEPSIGRTLNSFMHDRPILSLMKLGPGSCLTQELRSKQKNPTYLSLCLQVRRVTGMAYE